MESKAADKNRYKGIIYVAIASILWSTGGLLIKLSNWNPVALSGARSLISALVMLIYLKRPKITRSKPQILGAITYSATVMCFVIANKLTTAANAILLQYTAPIFVAILGAWILKEKIHWYDVVSIIVVFLGMGLFFIEGVDKGNALGNIIAILAGFSLACTTIALRLQKEGSAVETTWLGNILTFIIALPFIVKVKIDAVNLIIVLLLGSFQLGISYILYVNSLKYITAFEAILITVLEPLLNPLWVYIFTGEAPGIYAIIGGTIVILTVLMRNVYITKIKAMRKNK
ncbi:MAG: DMT family transporter [Tissierellia bacterium]|nr:DMT family transporter [Tissierellia bacterium]